MKKGGNLDEIQENFVWRILRISGYILIYGWVPCRRRQAADMPLLRFLAQSQGGAK